VPDTSKFGEDLKRELQGILKSVKAEVEAVLDATGLKTELKKIKEQAKKDAIKLKVDVDGDDVVKKTRRLKNLAQKAVGAINLWAHIDMGKTIATIKTQLKIIDKAVKGYKIKIPVDLVTWGRLLGYATAIGAVLLTFPHLLAAAGGAAQVLGGALAIIPGILAGASIAIASLVVGTQGFFKALSSSGDPAAFEEALKDLTPSAQSAARALAEFKEPLGEIRKVVQERLFEGMDESFRSLKELLPGVKTGLAGAAGGIRGMVQEWVKMATTQESQDDLTRIGVNTTQGLKAMKPVLANVGSALKDFAVVGSSFFVEWGSALSDVTKKFSDWAAEARKTGEMREWIENTIEKIKQMGRVIGNVVEGFKNIFAALRGGESFGDMMERITESFQNWSALESTKNAFKQIGDAIRYVVEVGSEVFGKLIAEIGRILQSSMPFIKEFVRVLGVVLVAAINTLGPMLQALGRWLSENKGWVVPLVIALIGLVTAFKLAATAAKGIVAISDSIGAMRAAGGILGDVGKAFSKMAKAALASVGSAITTAARWVFAWMQIAAQAIVNAGKASAAWIASATRSAAFTARYYAIMAAQAIANFVKMTAAAVANAARTAVAWIAAWVGMAAAATANAIRMAAAWVIAMGPVGWIIAAIVALVVLIIANWDSIVAATRAAWDWVWKLVSDVISWIRDTVKSGIDFIVDIFWTVVDAVSSALSGLWGVITGAFAGPINWVKGIIGDLGDAWNNLMNNIKGGLKGGSLVDKARDQGREDGGPVSAGSTYTANEAGMEMYSTMSGQDFLMAGTMGSFTPPVTGRVTPAQDLSNSLVKLGAGSGGSGMADALVSRVLEAMSNWSWDIQFDPSGVAKMVNKTNLMNRRRG
jgi:phage-related protein